MTLRLCTSVAPFGVTVGAENTAVNEADKRPSLCAVYILAGGDKKEIREFLIHQLVMSGMEQSEAG